MLVDGIKLDKPSDYFMYRHF